MIYHYHEATCPHCSKVHRRGCSLSDCTTAIISLEPFTASDGHKAEWVLCTETGKAFYIDFGNRELKAGNDNRVRYLLAFDRSLGDLNLEEETQAYARMARYGRWVGDWWEPGLSQVPNAENRIEREGFVIIDQETV